MPRRTLVVTAYLLRFNLIVPPATSEHLTGSARGDCRCGMPLRRRLLWKQLVIQPECTSACWASDSLKFNLMVSMLGKPTSASPVRCSSELWGASQWLTEH